MKKDNQQIKMGKEYDLDYENRYFMQNAEAAMKGDYVRALVEFITNCDESYNHLEENGKKINGEIQISIEKRRGNKNSIVKILDKAEGMTMEEMVIKLKRVGGITSGFLETKGEARRGLMGRGAKDCVVFGTIKYQSIKNGQYSEIEIKRPGKFIPILSKKATNFERFNTGIEKGNGTLVMQEVEPKFKIPSHESLVKNLCKYYSLRDIASDSKRSLILIDVCNKRRKKLSYDYPKGEIVFDNKINIPSYPEAETHLIIEKLSNRISCDSSSPYWEGGILVRSKKAIHEVTSLSKKIENNPYFEFYFGKVVCPYIDDLMSEYEEMEKSSGKHLDKNPDRIIHPLRDGLVKDHPFTKELYGEIAKCLEVLLKNDEDKSKQETREIENKRTKDRFKKLANEASKFIKDNTVDINIEDENYLTPSEIKTGGMVIIPAGLKLLINEEKKVYIYIRPLLEQKEKHVIVINNSDFIKLNTEIIGLVDRGDGILVGALAIKGMKEGSTKIKLTWGEIPKDLSIIVMSKNEQPQNIKEFQFEKDSYTVKEGKKKNIRIFVQWPEFIHGRVKIKISMDGTNFCKLLTENILLDYDRKLKDIFGRRLATGVVKILGLKAGGPVIISATLKGKEIQTKIRVAPRREFGKNFDIKIADEDLGDQRALLIENLMKINGRHKNIKRYLGPAPDFIGQNSIHFRLLMAELIADTVARRVLELNASKPEYKDMDVTSFYRKHREYMNNFLEIAHRVQIPDNEI